jgi:N-acetylmuramoyl-L-alanine amidase
MSKLTHGMIHCADTPAGMNFTENDIIRWHTDPIPKGRGWKKVGYSGVWLLDGSFKILIPFDNDDEVDSWEISNGASGWNGNTRHFCYIGGGKGIDTRTSEQLASMETAIKLMTVMLPNIKWIGHNQVNSGKYCPSFDVPKYCKSIGIDDKNIDFKTYL